MSFSEASDEQNYVQLESTSSVADVANGKKSPGISESTQRGTIQKQSVCTQV